MDDALQQAIELIKAGKKPDGGRILAGMVKSNPDNEFAWQWLAECVVPIEQKRHCLEQALRINPQNEHSKNMLVNLDFQPTFETPQEKAQPKAPILAIATKICPLCKSPMPVDAVLCPHCGQNAGVVKAKALNQLGCQITQLVFTIPILIISVWCLWTFLTAK